LSYFTPCTRARLLSHTPTQHQCSAYLHVSLRLVPLSHSASLDYSAARCLFRTASKCIILRCDVAVPFLPLLSSGPVTFALASHLISPSPCSLLPLPYCPHAFWSRCPHHASYAVFLTTVRDVKLCTYAYLCIGATTTVATQFVVMLSQEFTVVLNWRSRPGGMHRHDAGTRRTCPL